MRPNDLEEPFIIARPSKQLCSKLFIEVNNYFILQEGKRPAEAWQVCWEISRSNEKREMNGLAAARRELGIKKGGILTYNQEVTRTLEGAKIPLIPVWKWLLKAPSLA